MNEPLFPGGVDAAGMPLALHDPQRLAAVAATGLLDTGPEPAFEDLADLAAVLTGCSRAFITLVDEERSFWKSCIGVDAREIASRQGRVEDSFRPHRPLASDDTALLALRVPVGLEAG